MVLIIKQLSEYVERISCEKKLLAGLENASVEIGQVHSAGIVPIEFGE